MSSDEDITRAAPGQFIRARVCAQCEKILGPGEVRCSSCNQVLTSEIGFDSYIVLKQARMKKVKGLDRLDSKGTVCDF